MIYLMPRISKRVGPCPACGGASVVLFDPNWRDNNGGTGGFFAECVECGIQTKTAPYVKNVLEVWNRKKGEKQ